MYIAHEVGSILTLIDAGEIPEHLREHTEAIRKAVNSKSTKNRMICYMFAFENNLVKEVTVAISGFGNDHKSKELEKKLNEVELPCFPLGLPIAIALNLPVGLGIALSEAYKIKIVTVPYLKENSTQRHYVPADTPHKLFSFVAHGRESDMETHYQEYKNEFYRFLTFCTNAVNKTDGTIDSERVSLFSLDDENQARIRRIKNFLVKQEIKNLYKKYKEETGRSESYIHCVVKVAWQYEIDDTYTEASMKFMQYTKFVSEDSQWPDNPNANTYDEYIKEIAAIDYDASATLKEDLNALFDHVRRFQLNELSDMMKHCAETNLIAYLQQGEEKLNDQYTYMLFSQKVSDTECRISPLCDNCCIESLPTLVEMFQTASAQPAQHSVVGAIPMTLLSATSGHEDDNLTKNNAARERNTK